MTNDDRFDDMIRDLARSYNEPPATPRDLMWQRIAASRSQLATEHRATRRHLWWLGIAAALLLGVAIGRNAFVPSSTPMVVSDVAPRADSPRSIDNAVAAAPSVEEPPRAAAGDRDAPPSRTLSAGAARVRRSSPPAARQPSEGRGAPADISGLYRYVAYETLGQAEALLTIFRSEEDREARARVAVWARDVLTSTRLLLDSPAADDAQLAALLRDLELVLAQIAALGSVADGDDDAGERDMIDDAIRRRDVMPRLRTTIPAGLQSAGAS